MKKVYLNVYAYKNLGDDLFLYLISNRYKNEFYTISRIKYDKSYYPENLKIIKNNLLSLFYRILRVLGKKDLDIAKKYINKCDVCINLGGSIFMEDKNIDIWKKKIKLSMFKEDGENFVIGSNIGPFTDDEFIDLLKDELFCKCKDVCLRDRYSYNLVKNMDNIRYSPDLIFSLEKTCKFKKNNNVNKTKIALISVINMNKRKNVCSQEQYENILMDLIKKLIDSGYKIKFISFCKYEGDEETIKSILAKLKSFKEDVGYYYYDGNISEALNEIYECDIIFGSRFHANILGLVGNKTIIPMVYSDKTLNVLNDIKFKGSVIDLRKNDKISFQNLDLNYKMDNIEELKEKALAHFLELDKILEIR